MLWSRCVLIVCVVGTALTALVDLGRGAERAIAGSVLGASADVLPRLGSTQAAMAGAAGRAAKVSAELSRIATVEPRSYSLFDYRYLRGARTRPPVSKIEPERVRAAFIELRERLQPLVDENNAKTYPEADFGEDLLRDELEKGLYLGLRKADDADGENPTRAILATMLADLVDRLGTEEFDKINLARLTDSPVDRSSVRETLLQFDARNRARTAAFRASLSTNEQLLLSAVLIARGEFKAAREGLDAVDNVKTLNEGQRGLVERYRRIADFLDPNEGLQGYRAPVMVPSEEVLSVLTPIDGRMSGYSFDTRTRRPEVDAALSAAYDDLEKTLTSYDVIRGYERRDEVRRLIDSIQNAVRRKDLDAALTTIDDIKRIYKEADEPRGPRAEWTLRIALENLDDATRVLATRFVDEDEPFSVTINENFFGSPERTYDELPAPVAQLAEALDNRLGNQNRNRQGSGSRAVYLALNRFFNAILVGAEPQVTDKLGRGFFRELDAADSGRFGRGNSSEKDSRKLLLADARRFAALFREGKKAVGAAGAPFVAPQVSDEISDLAVRLSGQVGAGKASRLDTSAGAAPTMAEVATPTRKYSVRSTRARPSVETRENFRGDAQLAIDSLQRSLRDVQLQPGYQARDLIELGVELVVIAERGENVDDAYDRLIRPVLAYPQSDLTDSRGFSTRGSFLYQLRELSKQAQERMPSSTASRRKGASK